MHIYVIADLVRIGEVKRVTKETNVAVKINLDGSGVADSSTGIPFLDHMLDVSVLLISSVLFLLKGSYVYFKKLVAVAMPGENGLVFGLKK